MEDKNDIEMAILNAAKKIFIKKGKAGARMQEIADEANVNKTLLHYYFRSKDNLFERVLEDVMKDLIDSVMKNTVEETSFKDTLKTFIKTHIDYLADNHNILRFMLWELSNNKENIRKILTGSFSNLGYTPFDLFVNKMKKAMIMGEIKSDINVFDFFLNLISLNIFIFVILPLVEEIPLPVDKNIPSMVEHRKDEIFRLLWNDIKKGD